MQSRADAHDYYIGILSAARDRDTEEGTVNRYLEQATAELGRTDLFFLLRYILNREDIDRDWLFERCREVQASPNGHIDLWAREHYKSTIITFGLTIFDIINDPEITIGIFSHTRPIAKKFLRQIKRELEENQNLKDLYPEVFFQEPNSEAATWSEDGGLLVKRQGNPKELTVEAWGLIDGQPTGAHFKLRIYDDVVTRESVYTPEAIVKTTEAWELSTNLGTDDGFERVIGTRYHAKDTYEVMMERQSYSPRLYPATHNGADPFVDETAEPVLLSREKLLKKRRDQGPYTFGCQMLQNPANDNAMGFSRNWIKTTVITHWRGMNLYLLADAASSKKKGSDYTAMSVIGIASDGNYYLIDMIRDRMNLTERAKMLMALHAKYRPKAVGYERYGMMGDIEHIEHLQAEENYRFEITEVAGKMGKEDRIRRLVPLFEQGRFWINEDIRHRDHENRMQNITRDFIEDELMMFPVSKHDDAMDACSRIFDIETTVPESQIARGTDYLKLVGGKQNLDWMAA